MYRLTAQNKKIYKEAATMACQVFEHGILFFETDREKIVWKINSERFDIPGFSPGLPLDPAPAECITTGRYIMQEQAEHSCGRRIKLHAVPILEGTEVIGSLVTAIPVDNAEDHLAAMTGRLVDDLQEMTGAIGQLTDALCVMKEKELFFENGLEEMCRLSESMNETIGLIQQSADETKMTVLNSAIEAVLGDTSSFKKTTAKIVKLTDQAKETVKDITRLMEKIGAAGEMIKSDHHSNIIACQQQMETMEELTSRVRAMTRTAQTLDKVFQSR